LVHKAYPLHFDRSAARILLSKQKGGTLTDPRIELPQGTLDLLILKTVALEPLHGWAISERVQQVSSDALQVRQGSLYPALHRLERRGWLKARWNTTDNNRRAKYYELTRSGRKQLEAQSDSWRRLAVAVGQILDMA
jgi:PadR family transcriptional regulator PadR